MENNLTKVVFVRLKWSGKIVLIQEVNLPAVRW